MANSYFVNGAVVTTTEDNAVAHESHTPTKITARRYALTRFSTLKPPMHGAPNPIRLLMMLNGKQWTFFLIGFLAWVCVTLGPQIKFPIDYV